METLPGKKPLIKLAYRPPNSNPYWIISRTPITPNDEFFVRYHLSGLPETINPIPSRSKSAATAPMARPNSPSTTLGSSE
jgi:hypothetical protein